MQTRKTKQVSCDNVFKFKLIFTTQQNFHYQTIIYPLCRQLHATLLAVFVIIEKYLSVPSIRWQFPSYLQYPLKTFHISTKLCVSQPALGTFSTGLFTQVYKINNLEQSTTNYFDKASVTIVHAVDDIGTGSSPASSFLYLQQTL